MKHVLALDQGTASSRALLFDQQGAVRAVAQQEFDQIFPQPGWVEHNPEQIATSQISVALLALSKAGLRRSDVAAIGIANQRETTIVWNRETGQPVYNAIVWQDRRTADFCQRLRSDGHSSMIQQRTGLLIDSYFSGTKIAWIIDNVSGARDLAEAGKLAFGTVDSWLVWKLTHGAVHATDVSNASRSMLCNIHTGAWDPDLLDLLRIPASMLPEVRSSSEIYGETSGVQGPRGASHRRDCGRSAGRAVRATMHHSRHDEEHVRNRMLHAAEHRPPCRAFLESTCHNRRLENRRLHGVRP